MKKFLSSILILVFLTAISGSVFAADKKTSTEKFSDFDKTQYWAEPMNWAISEGLIRGFPSGELKPNEKMTEAQFLRVLLRYYFPEGYQTIAKDLDSINPSHFAYNEYKTAKHFDLPIRDLEQIGQPISRGSIARILAESELGKRVDEKEAVQWMYNMNLSVGYPDKNGDNPKTFETFRSNNTLTRAHAVTFVFNYHTSSKTNKILKQKLEQAAPTQKTDAMKKLNELYQDKEKFLNLILKYESQFAENSYNGIESLDSPVMVKQGTGPIIISAPHSTKHLREGQIKAADLYTGALTLLLHELTNTTVIFSTKTAKDANYYEDGVYKETLKQLVKDKNAKYVIDLHAAALSREFDIDLGTINGLSMNDQITKNIQNIFHTNNIKDVKQDDTFSATHKGTIVNYSYNNLHTQSVQMEINRKYRNPREDVESFYYLLKSLVEIITMIDNS